MPPHPPTMNAKSRDVVLTGVPRSGTTLTCHLLNQLPDTLALHEPMGVDLASLGSRDRACDAIGRFFSQTREGPLVSKTVQTKQVEGRLPVNPVSNEPADDGLRRALASSSEVRI